MLNIINKCKAVSYWHRELSEEVIIYKESKDSKIKVLTSKGEKHVLFNIEYSSIEINGDTAILREAKNRKYGLISINGELILKNAYDEMEYCADGKAIIASIGGRYCVLNTTGIEMIPLVYTKINVEESEENEKEIEFKCSMGLGSKLICVYSYNIETGEFKDNILGRIFKEVKI